MPQASTETNYKDKLIKFFWYLSNTLLIATIPVIISFDIFLIYGFYTSTDIPRVRYEALIAMGLINFYSLGLYIPALGFGYTLRAGKYKKFAKIMYFVSLFHVMKFLLMFIILEFVS